MEIIIKKYLIQDLNGVEMNRGNRILRNDFQQFKTNIIYRLNSKIDYSLHKFIYYISDNNVSHSINEITIYNFYRKVQILKNRIKVYNIVI